MLCKRVSFFGLLHQKKKGFLWSNILLSAHDKACCYGTARNVGVILSVIAECEDEAAWPLFGVDICHEFPHARFSTEKYSEIYGKIIHIGRGLHLRVYDVMESNLTFDDFALGTNAARKASARLWKTMLSAYDEN